MIFLLVFLLYTTRPVSWSLIIEPLCLTNLQQEDTHILGAHEEADELRLILNHLNYVYHGL